MHQLKGGLRLQPALLAAAARRGFDLVVAPWDVRYLNLLPSVALARAFRTPIVLWGHGYSLNPHPLTDGARNFCGRLADAVLLYTESVAAQLIETAHFSKDRVFVAQNALDQTPIQLARQSWMDRPEALAEFQRQHGVDSARTILFISRLEANNRIDMLLRATAALCPRYPDLKTVLIGDGSDRARLVELTRMLGIEGRVAFAGPIYEESELAPWMLSATLLCYPTNVGLSLLHAFGYGLPAVTSDNRRAQNPEIEALVAGVNGLEYRDGDLDDMVRQCEQILGDPDLRLQLSEAALQGVLHRYSIDRMVDGFKQVFDRVAGRRSTRS